MNEYATVCMIDFEDGTGAFQILHRGTQEDCARVMDLTPAVAYNGTKRVVGSRIGVLPGESADEFLQRAAPTGDSDA